MPGIVGIIGTDSCGGNGAALSQMLGCMMHEPFYNSGTYVNERLTLWVGWVSLAGSFDDCMPVWNETNDICLFFSGENFADQEEVDHLDARGHHFDPENARYLVHLYEELGDKFLGRLNGWFGGLLVDLRQHRAVLFNDRYGLSRIYYHQGSNRFYFASEAKALLKVLPTLKQLNMSSLGEFFSCGCPLQNKTLFSGVSMIPGGSAWAFSPGQKTNKGSYFSPAVWETQTPLKGSDYYEKLKETWARILPRYFRGKGRLAMSLTGGVDGRMILAWANRPPDTLPCYTFGGMYRDCVDVSIARQVAKICKQPHQVIPVGHDFLAQFPSLAEETVYITDGAMDVSASPDLFVNRVAREIAPVRLTGNYGQEILRSAVAFGPRTPAEGLFEQEFEDLIRAASQTYTGELTERRLSFVAFKQVPWHHYSRLALEQSQLTLRSPYLDNDIVALAFRVPTDLATTNELSLRIIANGAPDLGKIATDRGILYPPLPVITKLKHFYQELTFKAEYAYDYGMPQWLARLDHTFEPLHFERIFLGRHKFYHFRLWYRNELSHYIKDVLLDPRTLSRPYLNGRRLEGMVRNHVEGKGNYTLEIHRVLSSELIQRQLIEMK
jgi:asparagine synthase (glutamine-hydrolysing)